MPVVGGGNSDANKGKVKGLLTQINGLLKKAGEYPNVSALLSKDQRLLKALQGHQEENPTDKMPHVRQAQLNLRFIYGCGIKFVENYLKSNNRRPTQPTSESQDPLSLSQIPGFDDSHISQLHSPFIPLPGDLNWPFPKLDSWDKLKQGKHSWRIAIGAIYEHAQRATEKFNAMPLKNVSQDMPKHLQNIGKYINSTIGLDDLELNKFVSPSREVQVAIIAVNQQLAKSLCEEYRHKYEEKRDAIVWRNYQDDLKFVQGLYTDIDVFQKDIEQARNGLGSECDKWLLACQQLKKNVTILKYLLVYLVKRFDLLNTSNLGLLGYRVVESAILSVDCQNTQELEAKFNDSIVAIAKSDNNSAQDLRAEIINAKTMLTVIKDEAKVEEGTATAGVDVHQLDQKIAKLQGWEDKLLESNNISIADLTAMRTKIQQELSTESQTSQGFLTPG